MTISRSALARWFIPDLALMASLITLVYCLILFDGTRQLFRDSDAGWHIRTGESILQGNGLPHQDPYSLTRTGQPWFAWEWGSDVAMGAAHLAGGPAFVAGVYAIAIALCTFLWFRLHWACGGNFLIAGAMSILLLSTANMHWHARPHVFSWALSLLTLLLCQGMAAPRAAAASQAAPLLVIALLSAVWANIHASFFLLPLLLLIYAVSYAMRSLIWSGFDREQDWKQARWFGLSAAAAVAASFLNPYGPALHIHVFRYLTNHELLDRIGEFQSFNFHSEGSAQILVTIGIAGLGAFLSLNQRNLAWFGISALFLTMGFRSARVLPLIALIALPLANGAITRSLREARGLQTWARASLDRFLDYSRNLRTLDQQFSGLATVPVLVGLTFALLSTPAVAARAGFPPDQFPVNAAARLEGLPANARVLAPDMYGGYLIYRFNGTRKVWFDGRSDFYGAQFMKDYLHLIEVRPGWQEQMKRLRFTHALVPNRYSLVPALETQGWKRIYSDNVATLLQAPEK